MKSGKPHVQSQQNVSSRTVGSVLSMLPASSVHQVQPSTLSVSTVHCRRRIAIIAQNSAYTIHTNTCFVPKTHVQIHHAPRSVNRTSAAETFGSHDLTTSVRNPQTVENTFRLPPSPRFTPSRTTQRTTQPTRGCHNQRRPPTPHEAAIGRYTGRRAAA